MLNFIANYILAIVFKMYKQIFLHFVGWIFFLDFLYIIQNIFFCRHMPPYIDQK